MPGHAGEWRLLWLHARGLMLPGGRSAREAFELLRTALVYHRNALADYQTEALHGRFRPEHGRLTTDDSLLAVDQPLFGSSRIPVGTVGGMHVASASLRLPTALLRTFEVSPAARGPFEQSAGLPREMVKKDNSDWERGGFSHFFDAVRALDHCEAGPLGANKHDELRHAIVIILVHRDDFGHGEEGKRGDVTDAAKKRYIDERESVMDSLYTCRILEAQRALIRWCLTNLSRASQ